METFPSGSFPEAVLGQAIIELTEEGLAASRRRFEGLDYLRSAEETPTRMGIAEIDERLRDVGTDRIEAVGAPEPTERDRVAGGKPARFYKVRFEAGVELEAAVNALGVPSRWVRSSSPNYLRFAQQNPGTGSPFRCSKLSRPST